MLRNNIFSLFRYNHNLIAKILMCLLTTLAGCYGTYVGAALLLERPLEAPGKPPLRKDHNAEWDYDLKRSLGLEDAVTDKALGLDPDKVTPESLKEAERRLEEEKLSDEILSDETQKNGKTHIKEDAVRALESVPISGGTESQASQETVVEARPEKKEPEEEPNGSAEGKTEERITEAMRGKESESASRRTEVVEKASEIGSQKTEESAPRRRLEEAEDTTIQKGEPGEGLRTVHKEHPTKVVEETVQGEQPNVVRRTVEEEKSKVEEKP